MMTAVSMLPKCPVLIISVFFPFKLFSSHIYCIPRFLFCLHTKKFGISAFNPKAVNFCPFQRFITELKLFLPDSVASSFSRISTVSGVMANFKYRFIFFFPVQLRRWNFVFLFLVVDGNCFTFPKSMAGEGGKPFLFSK